MKKTIKTLQDLKSGTVLVEDYESFIENSQSVAIILNEKNLGLIDYKPPFSSSFMPMNVFANFLQLYEDSDEAGTSKEFLNGCISALNLGILKFKEDLLKEKKQDIKIASIEFSDLKRIQNAFQEDAGKKMLEELNWYIRNLRKFELSTNLCEEDEVFVIFLDELGLFQKRYLKKEDHINLDDISNEYMHICHVDSYDSTNILDKKRFDTNSKQILNDLIEKLFLIEQLYKKQIVTPMQKQEAKLSFFGIVHLPITKKEAWLVLIGFLLGTLITIAWILPIFI